MNAPDPQLLKDAHDAGMAMLSILESSTLTRDQLESASRWASMANTKLNKAKCQMSGQSRGEERG